MRENEEVRWRVEIELERWRENQDREVKRLKLKREDKSRGERSEI